MQAEFDLSIVTINYNGIDDTCKLISSIPKEGISIEVIVVDNASKNDEANLLEKRFPEIKVVRSDKNLGFAGGNNLGYKYSHGKKIFFINNDTEFVSSFIRPLTERMDSDERVGIVCPKILYFDDPTIIQFAGYTPLTKLTMRNRAIGCGEKDRGQYNQAALSAYAHGAAMLVRREAIEKAGLMPECYFLYYEEIDWSLMLKRAGYDIWYEPKSTILHKESRTTGRNSPMKYYYMARNRLLFSVRNNDVSYGWLSVLYVLIAILLKDVIGNLIFNHPSLSKASLIGIKDFLIGITNKKE